MCKLYYQKDVWISYPDDLAVLWTTTSRVCAYVWRMRYAQPTPPCEWTYDSVLNQELMMEIVGPLLSPTKLSWNGAPVVDQDDTKWQFKFKPGPTYSTSLEWSQNYPKTLPVDKYIDTKKRIYLRNYLSNANCIYSLLCCMTIIYWKFIFLTICM